VEDEVAFRGLIGDEDQHLFRVTDDVAKASEEIRGFYRNYVSRRFVGNQLVVRLRSTPTPDELVALSEQFSDICTTGGIVVSEPLPAEVLDDDRLELPRVRFRFDKMHHGRLRQLIDALNRLPSAPPTAALP
jgi:hypothetical protein